MQRTPAFALSALALTGALACGLAQAQTSEPVIGLITKTETNPFWTRVEAGSGPTDSTEPPSKRGRKCALLWWSVRGSTKTIKE